MSQSLASLAPTIGGSVSSPPAENVPVDVNTATADLLRKSVPKVGAILAQRIVEWREQNGPFKTIEDLQNVPGIGRRLAESLMPQAGEPSTSLVLEVRRRTLPPPWGAPEVSAELASNDIGRDSSTGSRAPAGAAPGKRGGAKVAGIAVAVIAGLCIGVFANTQSMKRPARELGERIEATRADEERTRADLAARSDELKRTEDAVKALAARVDTESAERKAEQARLSHEVATLHDNVKKSNASTEARIQRLRETLVEIELYHGANIPHGAPGRGGE